MPLVCKARRSSEKLLYFKARWWNSETSLIRSSLYSWKIAFIFCALQVFSSIVGISSKCKPLWHLGVFGLLLSVQGDHDCRVILWWSIIQHQLVWACSDLCKSIASTLPLSLVCIDWGIVVPICFIDDLNRFFFSFFEIKLSSCIDVCGVIFLSQQ